MAYWASVVREDETLAQVCARVNKLSEMEFQRFAVTICFGAASHGTQAHYVSAEGARTLTPNAMNYVAVARRIAKSWGLDIGDDEKHLLSDLATLEPKDVRPDGKELQP